MKALVSILLLLSFWACGISEEEPPIENEEEEEEIERAPNPLDNFDLSYEGPDEPLLRTWEFVNFQNLETGVMDFRIPITRYGHATYYQGGYEDNLEEYFYPLYLRLLVSDTDWETERCSQQLPFETVTFAFLYRACFLTDQTGEEIQFDISFEDGEQIGSGTSFDEIDHETKYLYGLQNAYKYEISSNRLYIYIDGSDPYLNSSEHRMVFLAIEEDVE